MPELLFEIGCEEIPADAVAGAIAGLRQQALERFQSARLAVDPACVHVWCTPRRLTLAVEELPAAQPAVEEELTGPPWKVAFDAEGKPTKAAESFAQRNGVPVAKLQRIATDKGDYVGVRRKLKAEKTAKLLPGLLGELIRSVPFPKSMRWGAHDETFVRPVHWLVALFDGRRIHVEFTGIRSGNKTRGHRFLAPKSFAVSSIDDYRTKLEAAFVVVDQDERKRRIAEQAAARAAEAGGRIKEAPELLEQVTHLVEWPNALRGTIEERFLEIPAEVISTSMADHQRYFSVVAPDARLLPFFVTISNMKTDAHSEKIILSGNQRVLAARLSDAAFFVREDLKRPLAERTVDLKTITFQAKLGSSYEKYERFAKLARDFNLLLRRVDEPALDRAALLAKADLTTGMVGEFPELQGDIGAEYARRQGEPADVAQAVADHYRPRFASDALPQGDLGALVGLADRIDTVVGIFGIGLMPTGTADPFALRRNALAILNILLDRRYDLHLSAMVDLALDLLEPKLTRARADVRNDVLQFFRGRYENLLRTQGMALDEIEAVLARGFDDAVDARDRIGALHRFRQDPAFEALATAFKRAANIVQKELGGQPAAAVEAALFEHDAERDLLARLDADQGEIARLFAERKYEDALRVVSGLREPVDRFFTDVLVVAQDPRVKANRLALLAKLRGLFDSFADFTRLGGGAASGS